MAESIISSVNTLQGSLSRPHGDSSSEFLPSQISLNVRGRVFVLDKETISHLPDSLLNTMFPNGMLHLGRGGGRYDSYSFNGSDYSSHYQETICDDDPFVDFDPDMLEYVLGAYSQTLDYDLIAQSHRNSGTQQATAAAHAETDQSGDHQNNNNNNGGDHPETDRNPDGSTGGNYGGLSSASAATAWLNQGTDGRTRAAGDNQNQNGGGEASPPNESMSTFTDSGSHLSGSAAEITQSTSSSAVLNYMRFVADGSSQGAANMASARGEQPGISAIQELPTEAGAAYYDRNPLVVLREELDYFVVPSSGKTKGDVSDVPGFTLNMAKTRCGELLVEDDSVFEPLERTMQRNLEKWRNKMDTEGATDEAQALQSASVIEQQLIDMLCLAGFPRDARWGCRRVEPSKTSVTSLLTVPLDESSEQSRMVAVQKLLLFYKKPARKCWWEGEDVNAGDNEHKIDLKLWCRRTWTLELVLI